MTVGLTAIATMTMLVAGLAVAIPGIAVRGGAAVTRAIAAAGTTSPSAVQHAGREAHQRDDCPDCRDPAAGIHCGYP